MPLFVYGPTGGGKSGVLSDVLASLDVPRAIVDCVACATPRALYETCLNQLHDHRPCEANNYSSWCSCENPAQFVQGVRDVAQERGRVCLVFDRAECNLHEWQRRLPDKVVPYAQAASIASQMWSALEHLHKLDVLHRDVKPQNLLVEDGGARIRVADFGMARLSRTSAASGGAHTPDGVVTVWYRAPEVLLGTTEYTSAVDVWSAACTVVEMCTGVPPFAEESDIGQLLAIFQALGTPETLPLPTDAFPHYNASLPRFRRRSPTTVYDLMRHPPHPLLELPIETTRLLLDCLVHDWTRRPTAGEAMRRMATASAEEDDAEGDARPSAKKGKKNGEGEGKKEEEAMPNSAPAAAFWCATQREAYARTRMDGVKGQAQCERVCVGDPACTGYVYKPEGTCELKGEVARTDAVVCMRQGGVRAPATLEERW